MALKDKKKVHPGGSEGKYLNTEGHISLDLCETFLQWKWKCYLVAKVRGRLAQTKWHCSDTNTAAGCWEGCISPLSASRARRGGRRLTRVCPGSGMTLMMVESADASSAEPRWYHE